MRLVQAREHGSPVVSPLFSLAKPFWAVEQAVSLLPAAEQGEAANESRMPYGRDNRIAN